MFFATKNIYLWCIMFKVKNYIFIFFIFNYNIFSMEEIIHNNNFNNNVFEHKPITTTIGQDHPTSRGKNESICKVMVRDAIKEVSTNYLKGETCSIKVAMYTLDNPNIMQELVNFIEVFEDKGQMEKNNRREVTKKELEILIDYDQHIKTINKIKNQIKSNNNKTQQYGELMKKNMSKILNYSKTIGKEFNLQNYKDNINLHHKFAIFSCNGKQKVIFGSYNWTSGGSEINYENCLITDQGDIISSFNQEFNYIKEDSTIKEAQPFN